jgi:phage shock protein PspC (stress-responsive transcriptional regulator)
MKKTFTINISGNVFHIDEDAYEKLQGYLHMLNNHFGNSDEGREILQDIEARVAELFNEKMKDGKDVIVDPWVDEIIARMGKPEDFMEGEEAEAASTGPTIGTQKTKRRMYRDPDHRVLGGVCGGMGAYFNIDPVVLRIIFFVLFWFTAGLAVLIYLLLWIAVPKARTTAQRLEMRGEDATVSNIEKSIKEEVKEVKASFQRFKNSDTYGKGKNGVSRFGDLVYNILKVLLKVLVILVGALLVLAGFFGLLGFLSTIIVGHSVLQNVPWAPGWGPEFHMPGFFDHFVSSGSLTLSIIAIVLLVAIPLLAILFIGTKMIFHYKTNNKIIGLASVGVWLVALFTLILVSLGQINNFSKRTSATTSTKINCVGCQTLILNLGENKYNNYTDYEIDLDKMKMIKVDGEEVLLGEPRLDIEKSSSDQFAIVLKKKARGKNQDDAQKNTEAIVYNFQQKDSVITFDPYYTLGEDGKWRNQEIEITVKVPVGKTVFLSKDLVHIIYDIENINNTWDGDMVGKYWTMTTDGLALKE